MQSDEANDKQAHCTARDLEGCKTHSMFLMQFSMMRPDPNMVLSCDYLVNRSASRQIRCRSKHPYSHTTISVGMHPHPRQQSASLGIHRLIIADVAKLLGMVRKNALVATCTLYACVSRARSTHPDSLTHVNNERITQRA